ncbi:MAG: cell division protein CrgA [Acidimicrobiales bacterium]|nr:cell division protein CrgA [Acidimicrobiales bacterium]
MARQDRKKKGGRVTPKGGAQSGSRQAISKGHSVREPDDPSSGRYTAPIPQEFKVSPTWVPVLMFTLLILGGAVIMLNYLGLLPGATDNRYLLLGLGFVLGGIITATQFH